MSNDASDTHDVGRAGGATDPRSLGRRGARDCTKESTVDTTSNVLSGEAATSLGIAIGRDTSPVIETALAVVGTAPAEQPEPSVEPAPVAEDIAAIIARLDARNAEIIRHSAEVLTYERKRPPVSMVGRETRSARPMCGGCGYGIRKETRQVEGPNGVYHPNCAKVAAGAADASKISPRYLAAIVPLTQIRLQDLKALPAPVAEITPEVEVETPASEPEVEVPLEDQTKDLVEQAVKESGKGKNRGRKNRAS